MSTPSVTSKDLGSQQEYYNLRAPEYDEWFYRKGRYDRGADLNKAWFNEIGTVRRALSNLRIFPGSEVLELASGTGIWTEEILKQAPGISLTVVDGSEEMIAIHKKKFAKSKAQITYLHEDLFKWHPSLDYDFIFFSFWLSHVPPSERKGFFQKVNHGLRAGGQIFILDSKYEPTSGAVNHNFPERQEIWALRKLNASDEKEYKIVKLHYEREQLEQVLEAEGSLDWCSHVMETKNYFIYAHIVKNGAAETEKQLIQHQYHKLYAEGYNLHPLHDPYEGRNGPVLLMRRKDGEVRTATVIQPHHCNGSAEFAHGGFLATLADSTLFCVAMFRSRDDKNTQGVFYPHGVTLSLNCQYISGARIGEVVYGSGKITQTTKSLIFVSGTLFVDDTSPSSSSSSSSRVVLSWQGMIKITRAKL